MKMQLDGSTVSAFLISFTALMSYLMSQNSTKARDARRRLRNLTKREIAWAAWGHKVQVWAASRGHEDLPPQPAILLADPDDEDNPA